MTAVEPGIEHAESSEAWLRHTLEEIIAQVRVLLDVSACAFEVVDWETGVIAPAAAWFETPEVRAALEHILTRPYEPERAGVTEAAIEHGDALLIADVEEWDGAAALRDRIEERLDPASAGVAWRWYRTSSFISCPVRTAGGRTLGVLAIAASPPHPTLTDEHRRVTEVFAGLAALALERSELLNAEAARARIEEVLSQAAREVTRSLEVEEVYAAIVKQGSAVTGAPTVLLSHFEPATQTLRTVASTGATERLSGHRFELGEGMIGRAAATGEPYVSRREDEERFLSWLEAEGVRSFMHAPIRLGPRLFGVLSVGHPETGAFDERALAVLLELAGVAAGAIANALEFQHERRVARALTQGFVPEGAPLLLGLELGVVYEPVGHEVSGGDFFGAWRLPGGATAVLIGDVSGKGLQVAAVSAMVRFFVEARTWDSDRPGDVLAQANAILRRRLPPDGVALVTAFLAVVDHGHVRYANAGHVPPLLVDRHGGWAELANTGMPLGVQDDLRVAERSCPFAAGDVLFTATDGLPEARRGKDFFGPRVAGLVAECAPRLSAQGLAEQVYREVERWAPVLRDDVAILTLRAC